SHRTLHVWPFTSSARSSSMAPVYGRAAELSSRIAPGRFERPPRGPVSIWGSAVRQAREGRTRHVPRMHLHHDARRRGLDLDRRSCRMARESAPQEADAADEHRGGQLTMQPHRVVSRAEWLDERLKLLEPEKDLAPHRAEGNRQPPALPSLPTT